MGASYPTCAHPRSGRRRDCVDGGGSGRLSHEQRHRFEGGAAMNIRTGLLAGWIGLLLAGCTGTSRQAPARASAVPTVATYSVADLYKNTEFSGASFSADGK